MTKEEKKEYDRKRYLKKKETIAEQQRRYYQENKEAIAEHKKQYYQENKDKIKQYIQENKKSIAEQRKQYRQENKETIAEYWKQYYSTIKGYCNVLRNSNIRADRVSGRIGKELPDNYPTIEYYIDAVKQPCIYCKKHKPFNEMGLDRIDNSKPHTIDNVVPCCTECNVKRGTKDYEEFMLVISKDV